MLSPQRSLVYYIRAPLALCTYALSLIDRVALTTEEMPNAS